MMQEFCWSRSRHNECWVEDLQVSPASPMSSGVPGAGPVRSPLSAADLMGSAAARQSDLEVALLSACINRQFSSLAHSARAKQIEHGFSSLHELGIGQKR